MKAKSLPLLAIICLAALFAFAGAALVEHTPDTSAATTTLDNTMVTVVGTQITAFSATAAAVYHDIEIPRVIGTTTITGIGASAFMNTGLTSVTFASDSAVTSIGNDAFRNNANLTTVILPDSLQTIGSSVFYGNANLTTVILPDGLQTIGNSAFNGCSALVTIYPAGTGDTSVNSLPAGVTSLGGSVFQNCTSLPNMDLSGCTYLKTINSYSFSSCSNLTEMKLPNGLESIANYAFGSCTSLGGIRIPASVTTIGAIAFSAFPTDKVIDLTAFAPGSIANAPWTATGAIIRWAADPPTDLVCYPLIFNKDTGMICGVQESNPNTGLATTAADITNITIPSSFTIGGIVYPVNGLSDGAFGSRPANNNIVTVTFAANPNITSIPDSAFRSCSKLTTITIPETVTSIGDNAFRTCTKLTTITIPETVTSIGDYVFHGCSVLKTIVLPDGLESIGTQAFYSSGLTTVTIPEGVSVGVGAFNSCSSMKTAIVSEGVTLGSTVFANSSNLERVDFLGTWSVNSIPTDTFNATQTKLANIYIESMPKDSVSGAPWAAAYANVHWADGITPAQIATGIDEYGNTWQFNTGTGTIIKYLGTVNNTVDLIVPNTLYLYIETEGEAPMIGTEPFAITTVGDGTNTSIINAPKQLKSVTISDGITTIANNAFYTVKIGSGDPNALTLGNDVATIGTSSFNNCGLTFVVLPESIGTIGGSAFANNAINTNAANGPLVIPGGVTSVTNNVFTGNPNITQINIMQNRNSSSAGNGYVTSPSAVKINAPFGATSAVTVYADDPKPTFDASKFSIIADPSTNTAVVKIYTKMSDDTKLTAITGHPSNNGNPVVTATIEALGNNWSTATMVVKNTDGADGNGNGTYTFIIEYGPSGATAKLNYAIPSPVQLFHTITYADTNASNLTTTGTLPTDTSTYVQGYGVTLKANSMSKAYTGDDLAQAVFIGWGTAQQTSLIVSPADHTAYTATNSIYAASGPFTMPNQDTTLYGIWASDIDGDGTADYLEGPYTLTYNVNGGNSDGPANATNLSVQRAYTLSTTGPTHADGTVGGEAVKVVFIGWTATADSNIYAAGDTAPVTITSVNIYDNVTVYAVWGYDTNDNNIPDVEEDTFTIYYDINGGDAASCPADMEDLVPNTYDLDTAIPTYTVPSGDTPIVFIGWTTDDTFAATIYAASDASAFDDTYLVNEVEIIDDDVTVYAVWGYDTNTNGIPDVLEDSFTIYYDINGGDAASCPADMEDLVPNTYDLDTAIPTYTVPSGTPIVFIGWTIDDVFAATIYAASDSGTFDDTYLTEEVEIINDDVTVYAVWGYDTNTNGIPDVYEDSFTLFYDANGGDQTTCPADAEYLVPYTYDIDTATVPTHADDNGKTVSFAGWSLDPITDILSKGDTLPTMVTSVTITDSDVTVYAVWTYYVEPVIPFTKTYRITASSDTGSEISPSGTVFVKGGNDMTFAYSAKDGYYISKVYVDGIPVSQDKVATGTYTFADVRSNHTIRVESVANAADDDHKDDHGEKDGTGRSTDSNSNDKGWGVLNLICAILAIFTGILIVVLGRDRFKDNGEKRSRTAMFLSVIALILGIVSVIVFFLTEDLSLPALATDTWTPLMFVLLVIVLIVSFVSRRLDSNRS